MFLVSKTRSENKGPFLGGSGSLTFQRFSFLVGFGPRVAEPGGTCDPDLDQRFGSLCIGGTHIQGDSMKLCGKILVI